MTASFPMLSRVLRSYGTPLRLDMDVGDCRDAIGWASDGHLHVGGRRVALPGSVISQVDGSLVLVETHEGEGASVTPFRPPFPGVIAERVVIHDPEGELEAVTRGGEPRRQLVLDLEPVSLVLVGMIYGQEHPTVWWWTPRGAVVELKPVHDKQGARLLVLGVERRPRSADGRVVPNRIMVWGEGAQVVVTADDAVWGGVDSLRALEPPSSELLDAWSVYARLEHEEAERVLAERQKHPLFFDGARQDGRQWVADVRTGAPAGLAAWGDRKQARRRIDQTVEVDGDSDRDVTITHIDNQGTVGRVWMTVEDGRLPSSGGLGAVRNRGDTIRRKREAQAFQRLTQGRSANPSLFELLTHPSTATPPSPPAPAYQPSIPLDEHQKRAVEVILGVVSLVIIQGPPGTGKTRVIAEALHELARRRRQDEKLRILVSSVQNEAVDNVVEKVDGPGMLVRVVRRRGKDQDQRRRSAAARRRGREQVIEGLRRKLKHSAVADQLARVQYNLNEVDRLRRLASGGLDRAQDVAAGIEVLLERSELISALYRHDGEALCAALRQEPSSTQVEAEVPAAELPESPAAVAGWWALNGDSVRAEDRGELRVAAVAVQRAVEDLGERGEHPRYVRKLDRAWQAWRQLAAKLEGQPAGPGPQESIGDSRGDWLDTWLAGVAAELRGLLDQIRRRPEAIARQFLMDLEEDEQAWATLLDRYAGVVAATCSMSARVGGESEEPFDLVIIDEAGRATPYELLIPMVLGKRVVLIGDDRQLPPLVDREIARQAEQGGAMANLSGTSVFGVLRHSIHPECRVRLANQYRMKREIGLLVSSLFYKQHGEDLLCGRGPTAEKELEPTFGLAGNRPLVWLDVPSGRMWKERNPDQTAAVVEVVRAALNADEPPRTIGVVCAYGDQVRAIKGALDQRPEARSSPSEVFVGTVDTVQGREYSLVLFVTSRTDGSPGFMAAPNRVNVALSRAQQQLIVIGHHAQFDTTVMVRRAPHLATLARKLSQEGRVLTLGDVVPRDGGMTWEA